MGNYLSNSKRDLAPATGTLLHDPQAPMTLFGFEQTHRADMVYDNDRDPRIRYNMLADMGSAVLAGVTRGMPGIRQLVDMPELRSYDLLGGDDPKVFHVLPVAEQCEIAYGKATLRGAQHGRDWERRFKPGREPLHWEEAGQRFQRVVYSGMYFSASHEHVRRAATGYSAIREPLSCSSAGPMPMLAGYGKAGFVDGFNLGRREWAMASMSNEQVAVAKAYGHLSSKVTMVGYLAAVGVNEIDAVNRELWQAASEYAAEHGLSLREVLEEPMPQAMFDDGHMACKSNEEPPMRFETLFSTCDYFSTFFVPDAKHELLLARMQRILLDHTDFDVLMCAEARVNYMLRSLANPELGRGTCMADILAMAATEVHTHEVPPGGDEAVPLGRKKLCELAHMVLRKGMRYIAQNIFRDEPVEGPLGLEPVLEWQAPDYASYLILCIGEYWIDMSRSLVQLMSAPTVGAIRESLAILAPFEEALAGLASFEVQSPRQELAMTLHIAIGDRRAQVNAVDGAEPSVLLGVYKPGRRRGGAKARKRKQGG